jgi:hypothetical protein
LPQPPHFAVELLNGFRVAFDAEVLAMTAYHGGQIGAYFGDGSVPASPQFIFDLGELGANSFSGGMPMHHEAARAGVLTGVIKPEELEGLRFAFPAHLSVLGGEPPKLQQARLVRVQRQAELT